MLIEPEVFDEELELEEINSLEDINSVEFLLKQRFYEVRDYIVKFFKNKEMYCGGSIPDHILLTDNNIFMVLGTGLERAMQFAYAAIARAGSHSSEVISESLVPDDVKFIISIIRAIERFRIPPEYIPGIILLYLEFCEGIVVET